MKKSLRLLALSSPLFALSFFLTATPAHAQKTKPELTAQIDATRQTYEDIALKIWGYAEIGYKETQSSALLQATLRSAGFTVQAGVAAMPTAFVASYGSGSPVIGILAEYDALPGVSQTADPEKKARPEVNAGHACGHHLFGAGSVQAAVAIKDWLRANGRSGTVRLYAEVRDALVGLDGSKRIYNAVWQRFPNEIRVLLNNEHVFAPFWNHHNGIEGYEDWADTLAASQKVIATAMAQQDTARLLSIVFDRLYVLRNQLVHGGATWNSSVNRRQVTDGAAVLGTLMPLFIDIMMDNPQHDWGRPFYPVVR